MSEDVTLWKLNNEYTLLEAICLTLGENPMYFRGMRYPEQETYLPNGAIPLIKAIEETILNRELDVKGEARRVQHTREVNYVIDINRTSVKKEAFIEWLNTKGVHSDFFHGVKTKAKPDTPPDAFKTLERKTALKLIIGMAVKGYAYDPNASRSNTVSEIKSDLEGLGIALDDDTIRKWLREATEFLPEDALSDRD